MYILRISFKMKESRTFKQWIVSSAYVEQQNCSGYVVGKYNGGAEVHF